jgi:hypothetical protein
MATMARQPAILMAPGAPIAHVRERPVANPPPVANLPHKTHRDARRSFRRTPRTASHEFSVDKRNSS